MGELIRICAWCQKDLDLLEEKERALIPGKEDIISHGMCEECEKKMWEDFEKEEEEEKKDLQFIDLVKPTVVGDSKHSLVSRAGLISKIIRILEKDLGYTGGGSRSGLSSVPGVDVNKAYDIFSKIESGKRFAVGDSGTSFGKTQVQIGSFLNSISKDPRVEQITGISPKEMRSFSDEWAEQRRVLSSYSWRRSVSVDSSQVINFMRSNPDKVQSRREGKVIRMFPNGQPGVVRIINNKIVAEVLDLGVLRSLGLNTSSSEVMKKVDDIMRRFLTWAVVRNSLAKVLAYQKMPKTHDKIMSTFSSKNVNNNPALLELTDRVAQQNFVDKIRAVTSAVQRYGYDTSAPGAYNIYQLIGISNAGGVGAVERFLKTQKPFASGYLTYLDKANREIEKVTNIPTQMPPSGGLSGFQARASLSFSKKANYSGPGVLFFPMQYAEDIKSGKRKITIRETDVPIQVAEIIKCKTYSGDDICDVRINSKNKMSVGRIRKAYGKRMAKDLERKFGPEGQFTVIRFEPWDTKELKANDLEYGILNIQEDNFGEENGAITPAAQISNEGTEPYAYAHQNFELNKESYDKLEKIWKIADVVGGGNYKKQQEEAARKWLEEHAGELGDEMGSTEKEVLSKRKNKRKPFEPETFRDLIDRPSLSPRSKEILQGESEKISPRHRVEKKPLEKAWYEKEDLSKLSPVVEKKELPKKPPKPTLFSQKPKDVVVSPGVKEYVVEEAKPSEVKEVTPSGVKEKAPSEVKEEKISKRQKEKSIQEIINEEMSSGKFVVLSPVQICDYDGKWVAPCEEIYKIRHLFDIVESTPVEISGEELVGEIPEDISETEDGPEEVSLDGSDLLKTKEKKESKKISQEVLDQVVQNYDPNGLELENRFPLGTNVEVVNTIINNPSLSGEENLLDDAFIDDDEEKEDLEDELKSIRREIGLEGIDLLTDEDILSPFAQKEEDKKKLTIGIDRLTPPTYTRVDVSGEEKVFELDDWPKIPESNEDAKKYFKAPAEVLNAFPIEKMKDGAGLRETFKNEIFDLREILKNNPQAAQNYILPFVIGAIGKSWFDNNKSRKTLSGVSFGLWDDDTREKLIEEAGKDRDKEEDDSSGGAESTIKSIKGGKRFEDTTQGKAIVMKINEITTKYLNNYLSIDSPISEMPAIDAYIYSYLDKDMRRWVANNKGYVEKKMVLCTVCRSEKFEGSIEPAMKKSEEELISVSDDDDKRRRNIVRKYKSVDDKIKILSEQLEEINDDVQDLEQSEEEGAKKLLSNKKETISKLKQKIEHLEKIKQKIETQLSLPRDYGKMELIQTKTRAGVWVCLNCEKRARELSEEITFIELKREKLSSTIGELEEKENKTEEEELALLKKKMELNDLDNRNLQLVRDRKKHENQSRVPRVHTWCPNESCPGQRIPLTAIDWENDFWKNKEAGTIIERLKSQFDMSIPKHIDEQLVSQNLSEEEQRKGWDKKHSPAEWMLDIPFICPFDGVKFTLREAKGQGYEGRAGYLWDPWQKTLWESPGGEKEKTLSIDSFSEEDEIGTKESQDQVYLNVQIAELARKVLVLKYYQKRNDFIDSVSLKYNSLESALGNKSISGMFRDLALYNSLLVFSSFDDLAYTGWLCNKTISKEKTKIGNVEVENRKLKSPQDKKEIQREAVIVPVLQKWVDSMLLSGKKSWQEGFSKYNLLPWLVSEEKNGIKSKRENTFGTYFVSKLENNIFKMKLKDVGSTSKGRKSEEPRILKILGAYKINKEQRELLNKNELDGIEDVKDDSLVSALTSDKANYAPSIINYSFSEGNIIQDSNLMSGDYILIHALIISGEYDHPALKSIRNIRQENDERGLFNKLGELFKEPVFDKKLKEKEIISNFIQANISEEEAAKELSMLYSDVENSDVLAKENLILEQYKYKQLEYDEAFGDLVELGLDEKTIEGKLEEVEISDVWPEITKEETEREKAEFWLKLSKRVKKIEGEDGSWETPYRMAQEIKENINKIINTSKEREKVALKLSSVIEAQKGMLGEELFSQLEKLDKEISEDIISRKELTGELSVRANLSEYWKKRNFEKTSEPEGEVNKVNKHRYVIQKHHATNLHFDLRLENDKGVLQSWAIPKHRMPVGKEKLLAVQTEDHPIEYIKFKGEIKEGYGKGKVEIFASGKYKPIEFSREKITFIITSGKASGKYSLIRTSGKKWLLMGAK